MGRRNRRSRSPTKPGESQGERGTGHRGRPPGHGRLVLIALAVFSAALATRLGFLWSSPDRAWPHSVCYEGDATLWVRHAASLQRGEPFEFDLPIHTPGMAYLLRWTGGASPREGFVAHKVLWCTLSAASCVLVWALVRRVFSEPEPHRGARSKPRPSGSGIHKPEQPQGTAGERVAIMAGLLSAASFALTVQSTSLNNETPYTFLLLAICLLTLRVADRCSLPGLAVLAVMHGVAVLFRAEHTLLFVLLSGYLAWRWRRGEGTSLTETAGPNETSHRGGVRRIARSPGVVLSLAVLAAGFFLVPLPWNIRSYRAIQLFNTVEPRPIDYEAARPRWTAEATAFIGDLPAFAREGNFLQLTDLAASAGIGEVTREFIEDWFIEQAGYVPRPLSPWTFVSNQGPLCFALANNASADGGFSTELLSVPNVTTAAQAGSPHATGHWPVPRRPTVGNPNPKEPGGLAFGNPRHLRLFQCGYAIGAEYLWNHPGDAIRLFGRKLAIFGSGLTQGLTPLDVPLGIDGLRRPADQWAPAPGTGRPWTVAILILGAIGLWGCLRRRVGAVLIIVVVQKVLIAVLFFGYVRQAASILPFFFVLVALGLDAVFLAPLLRRWPRLANWQPRLAVAAVAVIVAVAVFCGTRSPRYDVFGGIDHTPQWGAGAFESHQPLTIRQIGPTPGPD